MDWDSMEEEFKSNFKPYAADGKYDVVLDNVTKKVASTGTIFFEFNFKDGEDEQYPKVSRALFADDKKKFRCYHYRNIMIVLGASKENAQKAVENCEKKANREAIADCYVQTFNRLAQKHPTVKLEVTTETNGGKEYARGEFLDPSIHFSNNKQQKQDTLPTEADLGGESVNLEDSIPF